MTTIPTTLTNLTALWKGCGVTGLDVIYAFPYDVDTFWLAVGWDRSDQPSVSAVNTPEGMRRGIEEYDVSCLLSLAHGDQDLPTVVGDLFATYETLIAALLADLTLGRTVVRAWPADYDLTPVSAETGDSAELRFTIHVEAIK